MFLKNWINLFIYNIYMFNIFCTGNNNRTCFKYYNSNLFNMFILRVFFLFVKSYSFTGNNSSLFFNRFICIIKICYNNSKLYIWIISWTKLFLLKDWMNCIFKNTIWFIISINHSTFKVKCLFLFYYSCIKQ